MGVFVVIWVVCAFLGLAIGSAKGRGGTGFILGLLLGAIGLIVIAVMSPTPEVQAQRDQQVAAATQALVGGDPLLRPCPFCAEKIQPAASVCRFCGRDVEPIATTLVSPAVTTAEGWFPDPSGRYPDRWWDGNQWTKWTRDAPGGTRHEDPPVPWAT